MLFPMAIRAQKYTLVKFLLHFIRKLGQSRMCNGKVFFVQIAVMEFQCAVIAVVSAVFAFASFIVNAELFEFALTLNGLLIHAGLAIWRITRFASPCIELFEWFGLSTSLAKFHWFWTIKKPSSQPALPQNLLQRCPRLRHRSGSSPRCQFR